ncbi:MAG: nuclear transport factor 2 family protein [Chloroflexi bacterium]|nr:nuclear transport factor 2 family protein [Chloroflexota bacterium]
MSEATARQGVLDLVAEADAAFAAGDADRYAELFAEDGRVMLQHRPEPIQGRRAITEFWQAFFAAFDTSDWHQQVELLQLAEDFATLVTTYRERLRDRATGDRELIRGRIVYWLRQGTRGRWRISLIVNSQSHLPEPIP